MPVRSLTVVVSVPASVFRSIDSTSFRSPLSYLAAPGRNFALGAIGLTLVYGTLRFVNFAHGDLLTFGAYIAFAVNVGLVLG